MRRRDFHRSGFRNAGRVVEDAFGRLGVQHKVLEYQAMAKWKDAVGDHIAAASAPERVIEGVMLVKCRSSTWANELSLHKREIIDRINRSLRAQVITDIRFTTRGFRAGTQREEGEAEEANSLEAIVLDNEDKEMASRTASLAADPDLAERIARAISTGKRMEKLRRLSDQKGREQP